jgi:uncharacterized protein (DUF1778 family)
MSMKTDDLGARPCWYGMCVYTELMASTKERWDFRVATEKDQLVRQAAETADRTLTDFVVDAAVIEAERVLADRSQFVLDAEQWARFVAILDRPPQSKPGLEKLFSRPSIFVDE